MQVNKMAMAKLGVFRAGILRFPYSNVVEVSLISPLSDA